MPSGRSLRFSYDAEDDLTDILEYTIQTWDEDRAESYRTTIYRVCRELADFPSLGRIRDDIGAGVRTYVVGQHVIIYRFSGTEFIVSRIIHVRRDINRAIRD
jgi:toxin ParE1/3/4